MLEGNTSLPNYSTFSDITGVAQLLQMKTGFSKTEMNEILSFIL